VAEVTGFPEMMDGRVKTLHPKVHGGLLALRDNDEHVPRWRTRHRRDRPAGGEPLPVRGNRGQGADYATCIENIDIGGPAMIRAAAKNHAFVTVVVDPEDYSRCWTSWMRMTAEHPTPSASGFAQTAYARTGGL
jgi:phosphoribosylaminoimidazolecarboxamide formyltransferase/IMP cyclohydrolase